MRSLLSKRSSLQMVAVCNSIIHEASLKDSKCRCVVGCRGRRVVITWCQYLAIRRLCTIRVYSPCSSSVVVVVVVTIVSIVLSEFRSAAVCTTGRRCTVYCRRFRVCCSWFVPCGRTDRHDEANSRFSRSCERA